MKLNLKKLPIKSFDRYLLKELFYRSMISAFVCEAVLVAMQTIRLASFIVGRGLPFGDIVSILWGLAVSFLPVVLPLSFLFSSLSVFSQLSAQRELMALQIMGHSPWRLARSSFGLGAVFSVAALYISWWIGPMGFRSFQDSMAEAKKLSVASTLSSGIFHEDFLDMVFFAERVNPDSGAMSMVFLQDSSSYDKKVSISAKGGQWLPDRGGGVSNLQLHDGVIIANDSTSDVLQRIRFDEYNYFVDFQDSASRNQMGMASLTLDELLRYKKNYKEEKRNPRKILLELGRRFYVSLLCLLFAPLAFGVSLDHRRTAKSRALAYGIGITVIYYLMHFWLFSFLGKRKMSWIGSNEIAAWALMAVPTLVTLAAGLYSFRKTFRVPR